MGEECAGGSFGSRSGQEGGERRSGRRGEGRDPRNERIHHPHRADDDDVPSRSKSAETLLRRTPLRPPPKPFPAPDHPGPRLVPRFPLLQLAILVRLATLQILLLRLPYRTFPSSTDRFRLSLRLPFGRRGTGAPRMAEETPRDRFLRARVGRGVDEGRGGALGGRARL